MDAYNISSNIISDNSSKSTTDQYPAQELLDFSLNKIEGVYKSLLKECYLKLLKEVHSKSSTSY